MPCRCGHAEYQHNGVCRAHRCECLAYAPRLRSTTACNCGHRLARHRNGGQCRADVCICTAFARDVTPAARQRAEALPDRLAPSMMYCPCGHIVESHNARGCVQCAVCDWNRETAMGLAPARGQIHPAEPPAFTLDRATVEAERLLRSNPYSCTHDVLDGHDAPQILELPCASCRQLINVSAWLFARRTFYLIAQDSTPGREVAAYRRGEVPGRWQRPNGQPAAWQQPCATCGHNRAEHASSFAGIPLRCWCECQRFAEIRPPLPVLTAHKRTLLDE